MVPFPLPSLPSSVSSCVQILAFWPGTSPSGWYNITVGSQLLRVWCDMTTDGGGYTYYPCKTGAAACPSVFKTNVTNGCTALGLSMVIPRTQNHWTSMYSFITTSLATTPSTYFQVMPGITKAISGNTSCTGNIMNYDNCQGRCRCFWDGVDGFSPSCCALPSSWLLALLPPPRPRCGQLLAGDRQWDMVAPEHIVQRAQR